jgi:hypothetical protein
MSQPDDKIRKDLNFEDGCACYHPEGNVSLVEAVELCTQAIGFARINGIGRLLIDATQLSGFPSPTVAERYWIARGFAFEAKTFVTVSFALQPYLLDPERFGVTVATNLGMRTNAFGAKSEAVAWLLTQPDQIQTQSSES